MRISYVGGLLALAALAPLTAQAQSADSDEIVVTAQSRQTNLETTPLPVNVVSGAQLQEQGVVELKDLTSTVPGLTFDESPGGFSGVSIRGIGSSASNQSLEQSVGLFVDGVYHPRARQYRDALFDVERLEIIKGSQGVLFGRNTTVGAISAVSRRPGDTVSGYASLGHEFEFDSFNFEGAVDVPLAEGLAVRFAGLYDNEGGWVENRAVGGRTQQTERSLLRATFNWDPTANFNVMLKIQGGSSDIRGNSFEVLDTPSPATYQSRGVVDGGAQQFVQYQAPAAPLLGSPFDRQNSFDPALVLTYRFANGASLVSTTGYSRYEYASAFDTDLTPSPLIFSQFWDDFSQFTQELRLISPTGGTFEYVVGASYLNSEDDFASRNEYNGFAAGPAHLTGYTRNHFTQDNEAYSVFGQVNWNLAPRWTFQLGGRYGQESRQADFSKIASNNGDAAPTNLMNLAAPGATSGGLDDDSTDYAATLSYQLTDTSIIYANYGRGTKAGAFNNTTLTLAPLPAPFMVPAEDATTYEVGIKGRFLGGRAYAAFSLYHVEVANFQDSYYSAPARGFLIRSVDITSEGAELEGWIRPTSWLNIYGNIASNPTASIDALDERMMRAPELTYSLGFRTHFNLGQDFLVSSDLNLAHSDSYLHQPPSAGGNNESGAFDLVNLRLAVRYAPADIEFSLLGRNITDEVYKTFTFGAPLGGTGGQYNEPQTWMLSMRKEIGRAHV